MNANRYLPGVILIVAGTGIWLRLAVSQAENTLQGEIRSLKHQLASQSQGDVNEATAVACGNENSIDTKHLAGAIAAMVLDKIQNFQLSRENNTNPGSTTLINTQSSDLQLADAQQSEQILQSAISSGMLTRADVLKMRNLKLQSGGGPAFDKLTSEIFQALNQKEIVAQDPAMVIP